MGRRHRRRARRAGVPAQVIIVLAAPPAVSIDSPEASKAAALAQQLDLTALAARGIDLGVQYKYVNALNAVSATVRPDQLAQLRGSPEVAGVYPVRMLYPADVVAAHLKSISRASRPMAAGGGDGKGVSVALLDGPIDASHPFLGQAAAGWNAINGKPEDATPRASPPRTRPRWRTSPARRYRRAAGGCSPRPRCCRSRCSSCSTGALMGTTATLLAGLDRALDPNGDGNLSDHAKVILAPLADRSRLGRIGRDGRGAGRRAGRRSARRGRRQRRPDRGALRHGRLAGRLSGLARRRRDRRPLEPPRCERHVQPRPRRRARREAASRHGRHDDRRRASGRRAQAHERRRADAVLPAGPTLSDAARAPADVVDGHRRGDFRAADGTSLVSGQGRAAAARRRADRPAGGRGERRGAKALVLYGDGGAPRARSGSTTA